MSQGSFLCSLERTTPIRTLTLGVQPPGLCASLRSYNPHTCLTIERWTRSSPGGLVVGLGT